MSSDQIVVKSDEGLTKVQFHKYPFERPANIHSEIYLDTGSEHGHFVCQPVEKPSSPSAAIWRFYLQMHQGNFVVRSGLGLYGCYQDYDPKAAPDPHHKESDTEHVAGCITLVRGLEIFYPKLLSPELFQRVQFLLQLHDIGENEYGDQPDDGTQDAAEKDRIELTNLVRATAYFPKTVRENIISDFIRFQNPCASTYPRDLMRVAQLARVIDKAEAILSGITYEKLGTGGDLMHKKSHYDKATAQDLHGFEMAQGDSSLAAVWSVHFVDKFHSYYGFSHLLGVIRAGITEVRGSWFPWFDSFCKTCNIPPSHLTPPLD